MTAAGLMLTVLAIVVSADGGVVMIDRGVADGLLPGDTGANYYELRVAGKTHRIDEGGLELVELGIDTSRLAVPPGLEVKVGSLVEFEVPAARIADRSIIAAARQHLDKNEANEVVTRVLDGMVSQDDPALRDELRKRLTVGEADPVPRSQPAAPTSDRYAGMARIATGRYTIGAESSKAEFFNEKPDHKVELQAFWIDRRPSAPESDVRRTYSEAQAYCAEQGKRLPTEEEWETAARNGTFERGTSYEWTASWYLQYPGNDVSEDAYGRKHRVLRGDTEANNFSPVRRRFMDPALKHELVGFRCARADGAGR